MKTEQPKTFAEAKGKESVNWMKELTDLSKNVKDEFDGAQNTRIVLLKSLSGDWPTCACGNQCEVIARNCIGEPIDRKLSGLGMDFYHKMNEARSYSSADYYKPERLKIVLKEAIEIFEKIEERSFELIVEYHDNQKRIKSRKSWA